MNYIRVETATACRMCSVHLISDLFSTCISLEGIFHVFHPEILDKQIGRETIMLG